ncbi:hypothetical protein H6F88_02050 [Oculatella sp. FACHB-28]|uniref:hypothetical protein n=1 Tax=Oculatella sp. FACHB-28 TaxID=2692845 RepID=UPI0016821481|nr:hypothetical protein [Oculatella sp. FACHB-28]MBD2054817.1 hypothetical protein [Oculatella sp. FACHB-28]
MRNRDRFFTDEFLIQVAVTAWNENPILGARVLLDVQQKRGVALAETCYKAIEASVFAAMPKSGRRRRKLQSGSSDC